MLHAVWTAAGRRSYTVGNRYCKFVDTAVLGTAARLNSVRTLPLHLCARWQKRIGIDMRQRYPCQKYFSFDGIDEVRCSA